MSLLSSNRAINQWSAIGLQAAAGVASGIVGGAIFGAVGSHWSKDSTWHAMKRDAIVGGGLSAIGSGLSVGAMMAMKRAGR